MSYKEEKINQWLISEKKTKRDFQEYLKKGMLLEFKKIEWVERHLKKVDHDLDFSTLLTDIHQTLIKEEYPKQTFYDWVTVGYYYAVYHAALALLVKTSYKSKSHLATICGLILFYYHQKKKLNKNHIRILAKITPEDINNLVETQDLRERASYGTSINFEKSLAKIARKDALEFIDKAKLILEE